MSKIDDPRSSLVKLEAINVRLAERMSWPLWRHIAAGVLMTMIVAATGLPRELAAVVFAVSMVLVFAIIRDDKKRHGMFVSGYQRGRTRWIVGAILALALTAVTIVRTQVKRETSDPLFWITLAIVFLGITILSLLWEKVYRREIRGGGT